jgi:hypothetical protein
MTRSIAPKELSITIEILCRELPAGGDRSLHLGIQRDDEIVDSTPVDAKEIVFKPTLRAQRNADGSTNFLGPFAHGPKSERFIYLVWATKLGKASMQMVGRIKLHLNHLTWQTVAAAAEHDEPLRTRLALTNAKGKPVTASVRPDVADWQALPAKSSPPPAAARGVTFASVLEAAQALPGIEVATSYGTPALKVKGKLIARLHQDGECFVLRVDPKKRDELLQAQPAVFYVTDHYRAHPWVLVRFLTVDPRELPALIESAWRLMAPAALLAKSPRRQRGR